MYARTLVITPNGQLHSFSITLYSPNHPKTSKEKLPSKITWPWAKFL